MFPMFQVCFLWIQFCQTFCQSATQSSQIWFITFFWYFQWKLGDHKCRKVMEPDFSGKFIFDQKMCKKVPKREKIGFLDVWLSFLGIDSLIFSDSVHEVRGPCGIVCDSAWFFWNLPDFSGKISFSEKGSKNRVFGHLWTIESLFFAINDLKWRFLWLD